MLQVASKRSDIDLVMLVSDPDDNISLSPHYTSSEYEFIIASTFIARLIRQRTTIPVIEIPLSPFDIMRCIKLTEGSASRYALVALPETIRRAVPLKSLMQYDLTEFPVQNARETEAVLEKLSKSDYDVILCDDASYSTAIKYQYHSMLITSGMESIKNALDQAVSLGNIYRESLELSHLLQSILENHPYDVYVFDTAGELRYHSKESAYSNELIDIIKGQLPRVFESGQRKIYKKYKGLLLSITGTRKIVNEEELCLFLVNSRKVPLTLLKNGVIYLNTDELIKNRENLYLYDVPSKFMEDLNLNSIDDTSPIIILGEKGMDKQQFAEYLYIMGGQNHNPLVVIDCDRIRRQSNWEFLMQDTNSPLSDTGTTMYFRNVEELSESEMYELIHTVNDIGLHQRNRVMFEIEHLEGEPYPRIFTYMQNLLSCATIEIPPLRNVRQYIPSIVSLAIASDTMETGKEIAGIQQDAMALLCDFRWPFNYSQLRRVVRAMVQQCEDLYISKDIVEKILQTEMLESNYRMPMSVDSLDINLKGTLEEITKQIVKIVLTEEDGNQSAAARRLGIGRSTLWRMIKDD